MAARTRLKGDAGIPDPAIDRNVIGDWMVGGLPRLCRVEVVVIVGWMELRGISGESGVSINMASWHQGCPKVKVSMIQPPDFLQVERVGTSQPKGVILAGSRYLVCRKYITYLLSVLNWFSPETAVSVQGWAHCFSDHSPGQRFQAQTLPPSSIPLIHFISRKSTNPKKSLDLLSISKAIVKIFIENRILN